MRHEMYELKQMQSLPLEMKIRMTKERIEAWYESWHRFEIYNEKTKKSRYKTIDVRDGAEPELRDNEILRGEWGGQIYLAFSGGKDSTVLKHIVDSMYNDVPSVFMDTGLEYPEIRKFALNQPNVIALKPRKNFKEILFKYGYPVPSKDVAGRIVDAKSFIKKGKSGTNFSYLKLIGEYRNKDGSISMFNKKKWGFLLDAPFNVSADCCYWMKKSVGNSYTAKSGRKTMTATMADESQLRTARWLQYGCNSFDAKKPTSAPMSFWTENDVLHYLSKYNIPYCREIYGDIVRKTQKEECDGQVTWSEVLDDPFSEYDELMTTGENRTGCVFCMFGCHLEKLPNKFQRLKKTHPQLWNYCINGGEFNEDGMWQPSKTGLGLGFVLDYIGVPYE